MWHVVFAVCLRRHLMTDASLMLAGRGVGEKMGPTLPPNPIPQHKEKKQAHEKNAQGKKLSNQKKTNTKAGL